MLLTGVVAPDVWVEEEEEDSRWEALGREILLALHALMRLFDRGLFQSQGPAEDDLVTSATRY